MLSYDFFTSMHAIGAAVLAGAKIINMSYGGEVPAILVPFVEPFELVTIAARLSGVLLFASAGNGGNDGIGDDVDAQTCIAGACWENSRHIPCENAGVICVGALAWDSQDKTGYSNVGAFDVDIFAPGRVWVGPDPANPGNLAQSFSGTSAASPFAAGVAALIWAADPQLSANEVESIFLGTAQASSDPQVGGYVDALAAVEQVLGNNAPPEIAITSPADGSSFPMGASTVTLSATTTDPEDEAVSVSWDSDLDGPLGSGTFVQRNDLSAGTHVITATATDPVGNSVSNSVTITLTDEAPTVSIVAPADGDSFFASQQIGLLGTSFDLNELGSLPDAQVGWYLDDAAFPFAAGHAATLAGGVLSLGAHTFTFTGSDGATSASDSVTIRIEADPADLPPTVTIFAPLNGTLFIADEQDGDGNWFHTVTLLGSADDPEDGPLGGLQWSTSIDGGRTTVLRRGNGNADLLGPQCGDNVHTLTLQATDSAGNIGSAIVQVTVRVIC